MSAFNDMVQGDTENNYKEVDYRVANLIVNAAAGFSTILSSDGSDDEMISVAVVNDGIVFAHVVRPSQNRSSAKWSEPQALLSATAFRARLFRARPRSDHDQSSALP